MLQEDNWVLEIPYLNSTGFGVFGELFESVYE